MKQPPRFPIGLGLRLAAALLLLLLAAPRSPADAAEARLAGPGGACLTLGESGGAGAPVWLAPCSPRDRGQRWLLPSPGFTGAVTLAPGLCLAATAAAAGAPILAAECAQGPLQLWRHRDDGRLVGPGEQCLESGPALGAPARLEDCRAADAQIFLAQPLGAWGRTLLASSGQGFAASRLFAGGDPGLLYLDNWQDLARSEDGGRSFASVAREWAPGLDLRLRLVDRSDADLLFARQSGVLWRSADGGRTWLAVLADHRALAQAPGDPAVFFAASDDRLFRSADHGASFTAVASPLPAPGYTSADLALGAGGDVYLYRHVRCFSGHHCGTAAQLYLSPDQGASWRLVRETQIEGPAYLLTHPADPATVYWLYGNSDGSAAIERSGDRGATWTSLPPPAGFGLSAALTDPAHPDDLWALAPPAALHSRDRGATWLAEPLGIAEPARATAMAFAGDRLLVLTVADLPGASELELLEYLDPGWRASAPLRFSSQQLFGAAAAARPGRFYATEYKLWRTDDGGRHWLEAQPFFCARSLEADPILADQVYLGNSSCHFGKSPALYRSADAGVTLQPAGPEIDGATSSIRVFPWQAGVAALALVREGDSYSVLRSFDRFLTFTRTPLPGAADDLLIDGSGAVFATDHDTHLFRSGDAGATWTALAAPRPSRYAAGSGLLLSWAADGAVLRLSRDSGATWRELPAPHAWGWPQGARIDAFGRIFLVDRQGKILASADQGRHWQALAQDQPFGWTAEVLSDPFDPGQLLLAGAKGPYLGRFAGLGPPEAPPALALDERFEASLTWSDGAGTTHPAQGARLTDSAGAFFLFTPERAEVVVKLLDGRALNGFRWLFVGGATDVACELEIRDRQTGERRRYRQNAGSFTSFGDLEAFPLAGPTWEALTPAAAEQPAPSSQRRVELGGRFEVELEWWDFLGRSGPAEGFAVAPDSAAFHFFAPDNLEVLVNVLDGRAVNGHFWVYLGGLSNVGYRVEVKDRQTGAVFTYTNPLGIFSSYGDTGAW